MSRILLVAISVFAGLLPASVLALGLGEIDLKSGLNQPFRAEIPLTSASADEVSRLKVRLASADTFERYGLLQARFLTDFEFVVIGDGRRDYIRITSVEPVVEPFVTMLLEVEWAQGRLLREYTVLLDPPVYEAPAAAQAVAPARPAAAQPPAKPVQRPEPAAAPAEPAPVAPARAPVRPAGSFGPVQRNDTLWSIASRTRPEASVTVNQMMLAIFAANPEAFDGNINRLRAGAILRIPDAGEVAGVGRGEAFAEVQRQNEQWRGAPPAEETARLRLVPPAGEGEGAAQAPAGADAGAADADAAVTELSGRISELETAVAERERLLELKDQELAALQAQLAELREREPAAPVADAEGVAEAPVAEEAPVPAAEAPELIAEPAPEEAAPEPAAPPVRTMPPAVTTPAEEPSFVGQLLSSPWLYGGLVVALLAGLFVARRRKAAEPAGAWEALEAEAGLDEVAPATQSLEAPVPEAEPAFVVEEAPAGGTEELDAVAAAGVAAGLDRAAEDELPLERTLSSEAGVNLDQSDPLAEAEFHSAYGLYDQAADLLNAALEAEPDRLDLRRKLIEVYFSWDNRGGFLKAAQAYHDRKEPGDQFWNKVLVMGKQLCPEEVLFAEAPEPASGGDDMDLALTEEDSVDVDLALGSEDEEVDLDMSGIRQVPEDAALDFDLGESFGLDEGDVSPTTRQAVSELPAMESPTVESPGPEAPTIETPTIESPGPESPTMETPTVATPQLDSVEGDRTSETAALDLDELGLDLSDFEEVAADVHDEELDAADLSAVTGLESTAEVEQLGGELPEGSIDTFLEADSTAEMQALGEDLESPDLDALSQALEKSTPGAGIADTAEQPRPDVEATAEQPGPGAALADAEDIDLGAGELPPAAETSAEAMEKPGRGREGPTMTEVGTKLDLARAYIDMGDPEGARSILGEVVEEGDEPQRQEAQRLLDTLSG